ncbi:MAG: hypothetical protein ACR2FQ_00670 [Pseudonocardiaceae bacterium]
MIGGKVIDSSFVAALARGSFAAAAWLDAARTLNLRLYLPSLALTEVRVVRPDAGPELAELLAHPSIVLGELDAGVAERVDQLLVSAQMFDALAGQVVLIARQRRCPVGGGDLLQAAGRVIGPQVEGEGVGTDELGDERLVCPVAVHIGRPRINQGLRCAVADRRANRRQPKPASHAPRRLAGTAAAGRKVRTAPAVPATPSSQRS